MLVIATGAALLPEETEGLTGPGWQERVFTFYTLDGAAALRDALRRFETGRLVVNMIDLPVKCPVAPLEFCFLADWYFRQRGIRDRVQIDYVTSLDGAFTKATCNRELSGLLADKGIEVTTEFNTGQVDGAGGRLVSWDDREVPFDLLVTIPLHGGSTIVSRSPGLGDEIGFVPVDRATLQADAAANVFAIGDATNVPTSKAGSVAHFEGETLVENIRRFLDGRELEAELRRPHQLLHRDRLPQGAADRLQLRDRTAAGSVSRAAPRAAAAAQRIPAQPSRQARVRVDLLAHPPTRPPDAGDHRPNATGREGTGRKRHGKEHPMTTTTLTDTPVERDAEGFLVDPEQWTETMAGRDRA